jgi:hypothetical protein
MQPAALVLMRPDLVMSGTEQNRQTKLLAFTAREMIFP